MGLFHEILQPITPKAPTQSKTDQILTYELDCAKCMSLPSDFSLVMNQKASLFEKTISCQVHIAHFDHGLRGKESDGDRIFVQALCKKNSIPFHAYFWSEDEFSSKVGKFSQESARDRRRHNLLNLLNSLTHNSETKESLPGRQGKIRMNRLLRHLRTVISIYELHQGNQIF